MRTTLTAAVLAAATLLAACGDDDDAGDTTTAVTEAAADTASTATAATTESPATTAPATTATSAPVETAASSSAAGSETTTGDAPQAIVSLAPTHTETLFAIGAGDQVIAVDDRSNYPPEAAAVLTDLSAFEPNVEAIAGYEPDLVVTSDDQVTEQLEALGIEVWVGPATTTIEDTYAQIEQLGAVTGHVGEAAELVGNMQTQLDAIIAATPQPETPLRVYHELDNTFYSVTSSTFIGQAYSLFGLENIADPAEGDSGGYPQLNAETIIAADPEIIFLADASFGESLATVSERPGWDAITAVENGNVIEVDEDIASRWGPRIVDYVQVVADAVTAATTVPAGD